MSSPGSSRQFAPVGCSLSKAARYQDADSIENGRITAAGNASRIPKGRVIDLGNAMVLPGLIDCHTHLYRTRLLTLRRRPDMRRPSRSWAQKRALLGGRWTEDLEAGLDRSRPRQLSSIRCCSARCVALAVKGPRIGARTRASRLRADSSAALHETQKLIEQVCRHHASSSAPRVRQAFYDWAYVISHRHQGRASSRSNSKFLVEERTAWAVRWRRMLSRCCDTHRGEAARIDRSRLRYPDDVLKMRSKRNLSFADRLSGGSLSERFGDREHDPEQVRRQKKSETIR